MLVYGSTIKGDVVKRSDCILVYGSTTKGDVVKRSDCILVYGSTTKGGVVKRSDCILVYGSTIKCDVVKRSDCILVYGSTIKCDVVKRSDCILVYGSTWCLMLWRGMNVQRECPCRVLVVVYFCCLLFARIWIVHSQLCDVQSVSLLLFIVVVYKTW